MMKRLMIVLFALILLAQGVLATEYETGSLTECVAAIDAGTLTAYSVDGHVEITNNAHKAFHVGAASYEMFDYSIDSQMLYAYRERVIAPGESVSFMIDVPACMHQVDVYCGETLIDEAPYYEERMIYSHWHLIGRFCEMTGSLTECVAAIDDGSLTAFSVDGRVDISNQGSKTFHVGAASYEMFDYTIENQRIHDYKELLIQPGESVSFMIDIPACMHQLDVYCGPTFIDSPPYYYERMIYSHWHDIDNFCPYEPIPPEQDWSIDAQPRSGSAPLFVRFTSWFEGFMSRSVLEWDFGDGLRAFGDKVQHTFARPGSYTVTASFTDEGVRHEQDVMIVVDAPEKVVPVPVAGSARIADLVAVSDAYGMIATARIDNKDLRDYRDIQATLTVPDMGLVDSASISRIRSQESGEVIFVIRSAQPLQGHVAVLSVSAGGVHMTSRATIII